MTVYWRASDDPNRTSLRAETWAAAAGERSWKNVGPQLKPCRGWRLCARWRAWLRFLCDRSCGGNDPVEEISKPVATGLADVSTTRRVSMEKSSTDDQLMNLEVLHPNAAGIDIGNAAHYVAVPPDRRLLRHCFAHSSGSWSVLRHRVLDWLLHQRSRYRALVALKATRSTAPNCMLTRKNLFAFQRERNPGWPLRSFSGG